MAMNFKRNVGMADRVSRNSVGILILAAGIFGRMSPLWSVIFIITGIYLLLVVVSGYDPIYDALGMSTRESHLFEED